MRLTRLLRVAVLPTALLVLVLPGPRAGADEPAPSELVLERVTSTYYAAVFHDAVDPVPDPLPYVPGVDVMEFQATLTSAGTPVAGADVSLERQLTASDTWQTVGTATTGDDGTATFSTPVRSNAEYRADYAGSDTSLAAVSEAQQLLAMRDFNTRIVQPSPSKVYLQGNLNPGWDRRRVAWQKRSCETCRWRTIDSARSGENGSWRFQGAFAPPGKTWWFRAWVPATPDFTTSTSSVMRTSAR